MASLIDVPIIFERRGGAFHYLTTARHMNDVKMIVEQKIAQLEAKSVLPDSPAIQRWLEAEVAILQIPVEPNFIIPHGQ